MVFGAALAVLGVPSLAQELGGPSGPPPGTQPAAAPATAPAAAPATPPKPSTRPLGNSGAAADAASAAAPPPPELNPEDRVAAIVNDAVITEYDLRQRILLFVATSNLQASPEILAKLRGQVLSQLETEQLQIQEARRKSISVSPTDVDKSIDRILKDNNLTKEALAELFSKAGVDMSTLRNQIAVQIAWQKAVQDEFQDRVNITPADVDAEMVRLGEGADKPHFLVSSIFLAVDNPDLDAKVLKDAQDIYAQLQAGGRFETVARQFSQSPTAAAGGDLGWVHQGQLPAELDAALLKMEIGAVTQPTRSTGGYYIMGLRDRQEGRGAVIPTAAPAPTGPLTVARLLLPIGPNPPKAYLANVMKVAVQIHEHVNGCDMLPKMAQSVQGLIYQDLAKMGLHITDLSSDIQAAIAKAGPGEATPPFTSPAGIEMMVRCDKRPPPPLKKFELPTRQQVEENLFDQQITMLSRRYIRDLRRSANVEIK